MTISEEWRDDPSAGKSGASPAGQGPVGKPGVPHGHPPLLDHAPDTDHVPRPKELVPEGGEPEIVRSDLQMNSVDFADRGARIAQRAYEISQRRGFASGAELDDWLQAEKEIDAEFQQDHPETQFTG